MKTMNNILFYLLIPFVVLSCANEIPYEESADTIDAAGATIYGRVMCSGSPLAGVVVSDGVLVTATDRNGIYRLDSEKRNGHVFISLPGGYRMESAIGNSASFWRNLKQDRSVPERMDFNLRKETGQENHTMVVMGDIHLYNSKSAAAFRNTVIPELNDLVSDMAGSVVYGLTLGDMTWDWYWYANDYGIPEYLTEVDRIAGLTIFNTVGNHDHDMQYDSMSEFNLTGEDWTCQQSYRKQQGPTCYSYNIGHVHYISLDDVITIDTGGTTDKDSRGCWRGVTETDMEWLRQDLSFVSKDTPIVVSLHIPLFTAKGSYGSYPKSVNASVAEITAPFREYENVLFLSAHTHTMYSNHNMPVENPEGDMWTVTEWNCGAVCGNFWTTSVKSGLNICTSGAPGGYRLLSWNGKTMISGFKAFGKPDSYAFRSYDRNMMNLPEMEYTDGIWGADDGNEILINIWDYRPGWKISVKEGTKELPVTRKTSYDPLYMLMYTEGLSGTQPSRSVNIFSAKASKAKTTIEINVTDEFGRTFTERMSRPKEFTIEKYISE